MGFPHFVGNLWKMKPLLSQIFFTFAYATGPPHFSVNVLLLVAKLQPIAQRQCCDFRLQNIQCLRFRASRQANLGDTIIMELWLWIKSCIFPSHNRSPIFAGAELILLCRNAASCSIAVETCFVPFLYLFFARFGVNNNTTGMVSFWKNWHLGQLASSIVLPFVFEGRMWLSSKNPANILFTVTFVI